MAILLSDCVTRKNIVQPEKNCGIVLAIGKCLKEVFTVSQKGANMLRQ